MSVPAYDSRVLTDTPTPFSTPTSGCSHLVLHKVHGSGPWPCRYCNTQVTCQHHTPGRATATTDHVVPVLRGGAHSGANAVPSCGSCNASKGLAVYPDEWTPTGGLIDAQVGRKTYGTVRSALTPAAQGVLAHLSTRGPGPFTFTDLRETFPGGRDALRTAVGVLAAAGHVTAAVEPYRNMRRVTLVYVERGVA